MPATSRVHPLLAVVAVWALLCCACGGAVKQTNAGAIARNSGVVGPGAARVVSVTPAPTPAASGATQTIGSLRVTLRGARAVAATSTSKPPSGAQWLAVDVALQNDGAQPFVLTAYLAFTLLDRTGHSYQPSPAADLGLHGTLNGAIPPGGSLEGEVLFAAPRADAPLTLRFAPPLGGGSVNWTVPGT